MDRVLVYEVRKPPPSTGTSAWPRAVGDDVSVQYVSRVPRPPLDGLVDDLYYLEGAPPYSKLLLPAAPRRC